MRVVSFNEGWSRVADPRSHFPNVAEVWKVLGFADGHSYRSAQRVKYAVGRCRQPGEILLMVRPLWGVLTDAATVDLMLNR